MSIPANPLYKDATQPIDARVEDLLSYMTRSEKIGQMALVERNSLKQSSDSATYGLGGLLSGSGSRPATNTVSGWKTMVDAYQVSAIESRLGIPLLYGTDAVHGHAHVEGLTVFPHMIALGATGDAELVRQIGKATAVDMMRTGVNWNYAPNLDQPRDIRWGRVYEAFSDDPSLVATLGAAYLAGLQSPLVAEGTTMSVLGTPKHYIGLGGMQWGSSQNKNFKIDQGITENDEKILRSEYLPPFARAVEEGALSVMVGLNTWGDDRVIRQRHLLTEVLKEELNFQGFVVSDWYGVYEGKRSSFLATIQAVNAGVDMVMLPFDYVTFVRDMTWANRLGLVSDARIDDAVRRILRAKFVLGLFDEGHSTQALAPSTDAMHRTLAREAVAASLVLLKNEAEVLPLSRNLFHIRVAGSAADNVGQQMGAWTIEWQGVDGNWPDGTTSILAGIKAVAGTHTRVEYDRTGGFAPGPKAPVGIAIVGEKPYAEGWGDTEYPMLSAEDRLAIRNLQASCERVVVVVVAGRPLFIEHEIESFDGLVMAWLPGSEGAGVADGLFGVRPFVGRLPLPWPRQSEQLPIAVDGATADGTPVLFPRYFGL